MLINLDDRRIYFDLMGPEDGPVVCFSHSLSSDSGMWAEQVPELLAAADIALMSLFVSPLVHIYFENKFMDYMGSATPIVAAMGGQQAEIIRRRGNELYRRFRFYLWGSAYADLNRGMQACRVVQQRP